VAIKPDMKALDIACGAGCFAQLAAQAGANVNVIDASSELLAHAWQRTPDGDFREGAMIDLPGPDRTFDLVTGINVFQYASDCVKALRALARNRRGTGEESARQSSCGGWLRGLGAEIDEQGVDGDPGGALTARTGLCSGRWSRWEIIIAIAARKPGASSLCPDLTLALARQLRLQRHASDEVHRNAHMRRFNRRRQWSDLGPDRTW
jgi:SAM-dependent methyltransferase